MMVFIDIEVSMSTGKVLDYGAIREDGERCHTSSAEEFREFVDSCDAVCGHNIIEHDLKYLLLKRKHRYIDTLPLSPLLFPKKPYHRLLKDEKLLTDEANNPVNDSIKARDLYNDEMAAWKALRPLTQLLYIRLLSGWVEFDGFIAEATEAMGIDKDMMSIETDTLIRHDFHGMICESANIEGVIKKYPVELAYVLSIVRADDIQSVTPAWVLHKYPKVSGVMNYLLNTPCGQCKYCRQRLDAHRGLKEFFGFDHFREFDGEQMQQQAVEAALRGDSLLTIFPTGGGKSLTFQLPALMAGRNMHGLTVVITPLQSLMKDQVDNLSEQGINDAVAINGLLNPIERAKALQQVADGSVSLLYLSPEALRNKTIERILVARNVIRIVIDEAHCFSAWGQDFRVDYLYIGDFIRHIQEQKHGAPPISISCFTATAKQRVVNDIREYFKQKLGLELRLFAAKADRRNLHYAVILTNNNSDKYDYLRNIILDHDCPTIVYVSRTRRTKELAEHLCRDNIKAIAFNGKMEAQQKVLHQDAFMKGEMQVIVATSAFGMGVDKKDVGLVVHYDISSSLEDYMQEAGRAGRDPHTEADCYVLFTNSDLDKHFIFLNQTKLSISEIQQIWRTIRNLTSKQDTVNISALEIARKAGWNDETPEIETRVRAAISALEKAGYAERGNNSPRVFATGITVDNMMQARERLNASRLFDDTNREDAARIMTSLIGKHSRAEGEQEEGRVEYIADMLGIRREDVVRDVNLMRQEGMLADSRDMYAQVSRMLQGGLEAELNLEWLILKHILSGETELNYKLLNEEAMSAGIKRCSVRKLRLIISFLSQYGYILKKENISSGTVLVQQQLLSEVLKGRFEQRAEICRFVAKELLLLANKEGVVNFSELELLTKYNQMNALSLFGKAKTIDFAVLEEALLYLSKTELMKIDGGFLVIYNAMKIKRLVDRNVRYTKEQYKILDDFYKHRIQQIHIVGEYANIMVKDYNLAQQFVRDYFTMDYQKFLKLYFKGKRHAEINYNISPEKYRQLFGEMSRRQEEIINDKQSRIIVVAAGPGSGKTRVLVHKLASLLLLEDVKHEQLLMLTFSRAAATEFKSRLIELVGNAAHFVDIKTFHSFSFDLIGLQGSLEESENVVRRAAEMIEQGEVEESKITRSVLVIDEAQDMSDDDFRLVKALLNRNEEMRLIAVGDDDQNIFRFRGSDSAHLKSLVSDYGATLYEMTENYRSDRAIVNVANHLAEKIPNRMKRGRVEAVSPSEGMVEWASKDRLMDIPPDGTTAYLTSTNEQALRMSYLLQREGKYVMLIQDTDVFRFINLAEVRYFVKQMRGNAAISAEQWQQAKQRTCEAYAESKVLPAMKNFFSIYERTHRPPYYHSDLREFLLESNIEDFSFAENNRIYVSTIHKAKGREFDTVHLIADTSREQDEDYMRALYVGMTRAKHDLFIHNDGLPPSQTIILSLGMRDVWLNFFRDRKSEILRLRSGDKLQYSYVVDKPIAEELALMPRRENGLMKGYGYLKDEKGVNVACLSQKMTETVKGWEAQGYRVVDAEVRYILAWRPRKEQQEVAICLANIFLRKF